MTWCEITYKWHIFITERKKYKLTWKMILIDSQVEGLFDRGVCHWGVICSCKADLEPVVGGDQRGGLLRRRLGSCPDSVSHHCDAFTSKGNGILCFFCKILWGHPPRIWFAFLLVVKDPGLRFLPLFNVPDHDPLPVRVREAFTGPICGCLSGLGCRTFTSCLVVGWVLHCLSGPALHCHSPSHRRGPGSGEKH